MMGLLTRALGHLTKKEAPAGRILAYHGSPHTFDKFSLDKIGTGEGAQAYGHGLYFAEEPGVAQSYRDALSRQYTPAEDIARTWIERAGGDRVLATNLFERFADDAALDPERRAAMSAAIQKPPVGRLYEVDIPEGPYLDWDKPLREQGDVADALSGVSMEPMNNTGIIRGRDAYLNARAAEYGKASPPGKIVNDLLGARGVRGLKYLDQGSRSAGEGSRNYVIFNDKDVNLRKMLSALLAAGGGSGLLGAMARKQQEAA